MATVEFQPTQKTTITRTYDRPVTNEERLGGVPSDYYEPRHGFIPQHGIGKIKRYEETEAGPKDVKRQVPEYNEDGSPKMETVTVTLEESTYDQKKRTLGWGVVGMIAAGTVAAVALAPVGLVVAAAAVGAAAGGAIGYKSAEGDQVNEVWKEKDIVHPRMEGYTEYTVPVPRFDERCRYNRETGEEECRTDVSIQGYVHHHRPDIQEEKKGSYTEPELEHTNKVSGGKGTAMAIGAGVAIGLLIAWLGGGKKD